MPATNLVGGLNNRVEGGHRRLGEERAMLWLSMYERLDDLIRDFSACVIGTPLAEDAHVQDWFGKALINATTRCACLGTARWPRWPTAKTPPSSRSSS